LIRRPQTASSRGNNESSIYRYDLAKNAIEPAPLITTVPGFDADSYFIVDDRKLLGFRVNTDAENTVWFDPAMKAVQAEIDALMPATINTLSSGSHSETPYMLVDAHSDTQDHDYLLYHRESKKLLRLGARRPDLDGSQMANMVSGYVVLQRHSATAANSTRRYRPPTQTWNGANTRRAWKTGRPRATASTCGAASRPSSPKISALLHLVLEELLRRDADGGAGRAGAHAGRTAFQVFAQVALDGLLLHRRIVVRLALAGRSAKAEQQPR
jgi:hypothetical protein